MYLTDYREFSLKDVIMQLEPDLFRKVTGLTLKDFELLVNLGVFNRDLMNDAVYKFKRYEDSSLEYAGINTHTNTMIGGWDEVKEVVDEDETSLSNYETLPRSYEDEGENEDEVEQPDAEPWQQIEEGDMVLHKSWGEGRVLSIDEKYLIARFADRESKFLYPSAFEKGYLSCI